MEHLTSEALARLVDESPTPEERGHLNRCRRCRDELDALQAQTLGLSHLPDLRPPRADWDLLEGRLREEGLVHDIVPSALEPVQGSGSPSLRRVGDGVRPPSERGRTGTDTAFLPTRWLAGATPRRIAAGVALVVAGATLGAGTTAALAGGGDALFRDGGPRSGEMALQGGSPGGSSGGLPASLAGVPEALGLDAPLRALSVEEAEEAVRLTESWYLSALLRYRDRLGSEGPDPLSRYLALETLMAAGQAALRDAPTDPFLNGLLVNMHAEREAALQGIRTAGLPTGSGTSHGEWF
jgi:hypothetical protein